MTEWQDKNDIQAKYWKEQMEHWKIVSKISKQFLHTNKVWECTTQVWDKDQPITIGSIKR